MKHAILAIAALSVAVPLSAAEAADVSGLWLTESENAIVSIEPCGQSVCGKVVWLANPLDDDGAKKLDRNNPDPSQRDRAICGLNMIGGFAADGDGWSGGFIYDPEGGDTYKSKMRVLEDGTLEVRGYVGIPLLGKSQVWTRTPDNRGGC